MKKLIALVLALICVISLVGCVDNQQNISDQDENQLIYGETQEPSNNDIIHGEGEEIIVEADYPAMIMVNDILYYLETAISAEIDESAIIGYTNSYTDNEPKKNGETNFNRELNMPYAEVEGGIAVLYQNEWWICKPHNY